MTQSARSMYNQTNDPSGLVWVASNQTNIVPDAVCAGSQTDGLKVYVGRSLYDDDNELLVGKFVNGPQGGMYISIEDYEYSQYTFQLLTNPNGVQTKWALAEPQGEAKKIPPTAFVAGLMDNQPMYIGRTKHQGSVVVGHLYPEYNGQLWYGWGGREHSCDDFEILLAKPKPTCQCDIFCRLNLSCSKNCANKKN